MKASYATAATFSFISFFASSDAQTQNPKYEIGIRLSALSYQGDLTPSFIGSTKTMTTGFGIFGTKNLNSRFSIRANFDYNKIKGDEAVYTKPEWRQQRSFSFTTKAMELTGHLVYSPRGNYSNRRLSPYIFGGASFTFLKVNRDYSGYNADYFADQTWVAAGLNEDLAKTPPRFTLTLPIGAGFKYPVSQRFSLFGEATYRLMFTDYLDGFSKAADSQHKDHYSNISVGLIYRLGNFGINCPSF